MNLDFRQIKISEGFSDRLLREGSCHNIATSIGLGTRIDHRQLKQNTITRINTNTIAKRELELILVIKHW